MEMVVFNNKRETNWMRSIISDDIFDIRLGVYSPFNYRRQVLKRNLRIVNKKIRVRMA